MRAASASSAFLRAAGEARRLHLLSRTRFSTRRGQRLARRETTYRLHVPANVPAKQFWAFNRVRSRNEQASSAGQRVPALDSLRRADEAQPRRFGGSLHRPEGRRKVRRRTGFPRWPAKVGFPFFPVLRAGRAALPEDLEAAGHHEGEMKTNRTPERDYSLDLAQHLIRLSSLLGVFAE